MKAASCARLASVTGLATALMFGLGIASAQTGAADTTGAAPGQSAPAVRSDGTAGSHAIDDSWITTKVKAELATTEGLNSTDISVSTRDGLVTLTGVLPAATDVRKAEAAAKSVKGVREVDSSGLKSK